MLAVGAARAGEVGVGVEQYSTSLSSMMRDPLNVSMRLHAVSQVQINQILIRHFHVIRHRLEIVDHIRSKSNRHWLLEQSGIRIAPALHVGKFVLCSHACSLFGSFKFDAGVQILAVTPHRFLCLNTSGNRRCGGVFRKSFSIAKNGATNRPREAVACARVSRDQGCVKPFPMAAPQWESVPTECRRFDETRSTDGGHSCAPAAAKP